jgi:hypothetical protein
MMSAVTIAEIERRGQELAQLIESAQPPSRRLTIGQAQGVVEKVRGWPPSYNTIRNWAISHKIGELLPHGGWVIFEDRLLRIMGAD